MEPKRTEWASPGLLFMIILVIGLLVMTFGPIGRQNLEDQERASIRRELLAHNSRVDPRPSCAGAWGKELQDLAIREGYCEGLQTPDYRPRVSQALRPSSEITFTQAYVAPPKKLYADATAFCNKPDLSPEAVDWCIKYPQRKADWEKAHPDVVAQAQKRAEWEKSH